MRRSLILSLAGAVALLLIVIGGGHLVRAGGQDGAGEPAPAEAPPPAYPPFTVAPRTEAIAANTGLYPCTMCHAPGVMEPNATVRELAMHSEKVLDHGNGLFWCLTCHSADNRDVLVSVTGAPISFDESYTLCAQCHSERARDFFFGGHGKRLNTWNGERVLTMCVECHNPHAPAIAARMPVAPPKLRPGLPEPPPHEPREKPWDVFRESRGLPGDSAEPVGDGEQVVP